MSSRRRATKPNLYIYVEGASDLAFFESVMEPALRGRYLVRVNPHSRDPDDVISEIAGAIKRVGHHVALVVDRDSGDHPCRTKCKDYWQKKYPSFDSSEIHIVEEEIEGWYIAGASPSTLKSLGVAEPADCSTTTKEDFLTCVPDGTTELEFRAQLLSGYSIPRARTRSASFDRFCNKHSI